MRGGDPLTEKHETRSHSSRGASGAHRWIACPGSVAAQAGLPNTSNEAAARGTAAHELADKCLQNGYDAERFRGDVIVVEKWSFEVDDTMIEGVQLYLDTCRADVEVGDQYFTETTFDLSHLYPGMFGTNDWCVYKPKQRRLIVRDYKNGYGIVEAAFNWQLIYYGIGAAHSLKLPIDTITVSIVQPNAPHVLGPVREWTFDALDLVDFEIELAAAAKRSADPNAPRIAGDHCQYCLAAHDCPALTAQQMKFAAAEFDPLVVDVKVEKLTQLLDAATMMEARLSAAWALAQNLAEQGVEIPGYKLVERKTRRKWSIEDESERNAAIEAYAADKVHDVADLYTRKLKSPAQIEKVLKAPRGGKDALLAEFNRKFTTRPPGGKTLARDVDPRVALLPSDPAADFEVIDATPSLMF